MKYNIISNYIYNTFITYWYLIYENNYYDNIIQKYWLSSNISHAILNSLK